MVGRSLRVGIGVALAAIAISGCGDEPREKPSIEERLQNATERAREARHAQDCALSHLDDAIDGSGTGEGC